MKNCPDKKYISAYLDGELDNDSYEARHIAECDKCQYLIAEYAAIGKAFKKNLSASIPPDLAERVKFGVQKRLNPGKSYSVSVPAFIFRMAAGFMVFLGLLALGISYFRDGSPRNNSTELASVKQTPYIISADAAKNSGSGILKLEDLYKVSHKGIPENLQLDTFVRRTVLNDTVSENWSVKDFNSVYGVISKFNPSGKLPIEVRVISGPEEKLRVVFKSTEENIKKFTDLCSAAGFINKLAVNIPSSGDSIQNKKQDIILKADFVLEKK